MSQIRMSVRHGQTQEEARRRLESAVGQVRGGPLGGMVQQADWSADRNAVRLSGKGFEIDLRVDAQDLHVAGNVHFLGGLLSSPVVAGLRKVLETTFQKRLPPG